MRLRLLALALVCAALPASAQTLRADARPVAGTLTARADAPPAALDLALRVSDANVVTDCPGRLGAGAPDAVVDWAGGDLGVWARIATDATLTVITPGGDVLCDDDTDGILPVVQVPDAPAGRYAVWLGAFVEDGGLAGTLYAGTRPDVRLDAGARAQAGEVALRGGFGEHQETVFASGQDRVEGVAGPDGEPCDGFVRADRAALRVRYQGDGAPLAFEATADADLVLFVHTPDGLVCNDDANLSSVDPLLVLLDAPSGDYTVWVGTWGSVARTSDLEARLTVTYGRVDEDDVIETIELDLDGPPVGGPLAGGPYSTGTFTPFQTDAAPALRVDYASGEALRLPLPAGAAAGAVPNPVQGSACQGLLPHAPSARVRLDADGPLALRAESETDLVLVARLPDGGWMCSDDAEGPNPGIQIDGAQRGDLTVWVGTYSPSDAADAVLTLEAGTVDAPPPPPPFGSGGGTAGGPPFVAAVYSGGLSPEAPQRTLQLSGPRVRANVLVAGDVENPLEGAACVGYLTTEPSAAVDVAEGGALSVRAFSATDAVMVVRTPGGDWFCSDDAEGTEPEVLLDGEAGTYSVWLGTFSSAGDPAQMTLTVARTDG